VKLKLVVIVAATAAEERVWPDVAAGGDDGQAKVGRDMVEKPKLATMTADEERAWPSLTGSS
jgi:hypothetical protein